MNDPLIKEWEDLSARYHQLFLTSDSEADYIRRNCLVPLVAEHLRVSDGEKVLDIGCGSGWLSKLVPQGMYHGIDVALPLNLSTHHNYRKESLLDTTFEDGSCDVCVACMLLPFLSHLDRSFAKLYALLKPSGRMLAIIPEPHFYNTGEVTADGDFLLKRSLRHAMPFTITIGNELPPITYILRRTSHYINAAVAAGFKVDGLYESFLDEEDFYRQFTRSTLNKLRSGKIPMFQLMIFTKA